MSVAPVPGHQERVEALRAAPPLEGGLPCIVPRTEHCWHQGPFISSHVKGWQTEQCCFCPAHRQTEYELRAPEGHGPHIPPTLYKWFPKEGA